MKKSVLTTNYGENQVLHTVRIEDDFPCPAEGQDAFRALMTFMQNITMAPDLVRHIAPCPLGVTFYHDVDHWCMETRSVVQRQD